MFRLLRSLWVKHQLVDAGVLMYGYRPLSLNVCLQTVEEILRLCCAVAAEGKSDYNQCLFHLLLLPSVDDALEVGSLEAGTANESTIDVGFCKQLRGVTCLTATAI